ncbi:MAG TPA: phosphoribosylaminoimidazolesuccinocarboxamide synthase [Bacteroidota bacterium]|nr:phosphoribosylaminoimidazolesuccinocarboxamide synthase [Bacteroidota bacterium]
MVVDSDDKVTTSQKRERIGEREGKTLYHSERPDLIIQEFMEDTPGTNGRQGEISALRNEISSYLFEYIEGFRIPTHFVSKHSTTAMVVKRIEMIPLTVRVYNAGSGSLMKRFGIKTNSILDFPVIEHYHTGGKRAPQWINEYHTYAFNLLSPEEYKQINRIASKVNAVLRGLCDRRQLFVANLQLAFGRYKDQIVLGDELSPFTCHFWDVTQRGNPDQERYIPDRENATEAFSELYGRFILKV